MEESTDKTVEAAAEIQPQGEMRESTEEWRKLVATIPDYIAIHDRTGRYLYLNHYAEGFSEKDVVGKSLYDFITDDSGELYRRYFDACLNSQQTQRFEHSAFGNNMAVRTYDNYLVPMMEEGQVAKVMSIAMDITERKQAEEMLRKSEERFRRVSATITDISYSCKKDQDGSYFIDWMTGAVEQITGYSIPEIIKMGCWGDIVIEKDFERFRQNVAALAPGSSANCELRLKRKTGETVWVASYAECIPDPEKSANCKLYGALVDITMRKQSDAQFRNIIEKNPMSIQILNMDGYTIQTNPAHTKLFGVKTPADYSIFQDTQLLKQGLGELFDRIKQGEVVYFPDSHFNVHDVDPSFPDVLAWIKAVGFTLNDENGVPDRVVLMHENITGRKHAEALFQDIVEKNPISIQIVDKEGCTVDTNPAFTRLFGVPPPPDFSIFDDLQRKSPELEKVILLAKSGEVVNLPDLYYNPHDVSPDIPDNPLWIRAIIFPLKDLHGKPERFVFMHENITDRKNAEIAFKKKSDELEQFNSLMVGREIKMIDLKKEINELLRRLGEAAKYQIHT